MNNGAYDLWTWSHSRVGSYKNCPYEFYLSYIEGDRGEGNFYSEYGSFMHKLLENYYLGYLTKEQMVTSYLTGFKKEVTKSPSSHKTFKEYYINGLEYCKSITPLEGEILAVEKELRFDVEYDNDTYSFIGYADLIFRNSDGELCLMDHKSKRLKPRSKKNNTKTDIELDSYLNQLYLYSSPIKSLYGEYPKWLMFNCFRDGIVIREEFDPERVGALNKSLVETIQKIKADKEFKPNIDEFYCYNLCNHRKDCEYARLSR